METFSKKNLLCNSLINFVYYSFDFLLGMFLNMLEEKWEKNLNQIDFNLIKDTKVMSNIYNTFYNIIFAKHLIIQKLFHSQPLIISLYGERNWWKDLYPFVVLSEYQS